MTHNTGAHHYTPGSDDEVNLRELIHNLWQGRMTISLTALFASVAAIVIGHLTAEYVSEGLFQTNVYGLSRDAEFDSNKDKDKDKDIVGVTAYNYGKYAEVIASVHNYNVYLDKMKDVPDSVMLLLRNQGQSRDAIQNMFSPVFLGTDKDQKKWGVQLDSAKVGTLFGLAVSISAKEPNNGGAIAVLGSYARDTVAHLTFKDYFPAMCERQNRKILSLKSNIASTNFDLKQEIERIAILKPLVDSTLREGRSDARQIVSVDGVSKNFLPPRLHASAAEVKVAELKLQNKRYQILIQESMAMAQFYCAADAVLANWTGVDAFIRELEDIGNQTISSHKIDGELAVRLNNTVQLEVDMFREGITRRMKFLQPTDQMESKIRKVGLGFFGVLGLLAGIVLGSIVVLIKNWWRLPLLRGGSL